MSIKDFIYKQKVKAVHLAIKASVFLNWPSLTARLFALVARNINSGTQFKVLALGRSIFDDDIRAMVEFSGRINYQVIHLPFFYLLFKHFTDKSQRDLITDSNYHVEDYCLEGKIKYRKYLAEMIPKLQNFLGFKAVISGNIGYIVQQELAKVCSEINVPFIVLHKEALVVLPAYGNFLQNYRFHHFVGDKVLFYNKQCMQGFLDLQIPGLVPEKAEMVGIPRLDHYFYKPHEASQEENLIVFFSFIPRYSCRFLTSDQDKLARIDERGREFFRTVFKFAEKHPEFKFIIKTKMASQYCEYPTKILNEMYPQGLSNLTIVNHGDPAELIRKAKMVIGFNSTTLVEALIAGKRIAMPDFSDIMAPEAWSFFQEHSSLIRTAKSPEELELCLLDPVSRNAEVKNDFLEKYISTCSGGACTRLESIIIGMINTNK